MRCAAENVHLENHHRRRKGMGGSKLLDVPSNLIRLCGRGNVDGCHGFAHGPARAAAEYAGLRVPDGIPPSSWPVRYRDGWWLLDDDGNRIPTDPPRSDS